MASLDELWRYRELLYFLAWRDVKVRYKQAALGAAWAVLQPFITMLVFTLFFSRLAHVGSTGVPYPLFSFCGLVAWTYFSSTLSLAGNSLLANSTLITKVYFPRVLLPAAAAAGGLLDLVIALAVLGGMMVYYRTAPGWPWLIFAPVPIVEMVVLVIGASMLLAALNVRYRDVKYVIPFMIQLGLFVTPIIYPIDFLPPKYQTLAALNPMTGVVEGLRASILPNGSIDWHAQWVSAAVTLVVFIVGLVYFRKAEREFADVI